jgi:Putative amidoligase enzyme
MTSKRDELHQVMKSLKFGVEIETVRLPQTQIAATVAAALSGRVDAYNPRNVIDQQGRTWRVVADGSLSGAHNGELVTPILTYDDLERLQTVVRALRAAGAKVDRTCGLHIHVGAETFDAGALVRLIKMVHLSGAPDKRTYPDLRVIRTGQVAIESLVGNAQSQQARLRIIHPSERREELD